MRDRNRLFGVAVGLVATVLVAASACSSRDYVPPPPMPPDPVYDTQPNVTESVVDYPSFTVPASTPTAEGMIWNTPGPAPKPCNNCYITGMWADLVYPDGRTANHDTGMMLHHMVVFASGKSDPTCGTSFLGLLGQRIFASGNERTKLVSPKGFGYHTGNESWMGLYDLMNMNTVPQNVKVRMHFQWVPDTTPGMTKVTPVWLDVFQCGTSEVPAMQGRYSYNYTWNVNVPGRIVGIGGHLHDGGTHLTAVNDTRRQTICDMVAGYGGPGFEPPHDHSGGGHGGSSGALSKMSVCVGTGTNPVATLRAGEKVSIHAYYDSAAHAQHGDHPVMGIAIAYVAA